MIRAIAAIILLFILPLFSVTAKANTDMVAFFTNEEILVLLDSHRVALYHWTEGRHLETLYTASPNGKLVGLDRSREALTTDRQHLYFYEQRPKRLELVLYHLGSKSEVLRYPLKSLPRRSYNKAKDYLALGYNSKYLTIDLKNYTVTESKAGSVFSLIALSGLGLPKNGADASIEEKDTVTTADINNGILRVELTKKTGMVGSTTLWSGPFSSRNGIPNTLSINFSPNGSKLLVSDKSNQIFIYNSSNGDVLTTINPRQQGLLND